MHWNLVLPLTPVHPVEIPIEVSVLDSLYDPEPSWVELEQTCQIIDIVGKDSYWLTFIPPQFFNTGNRFAVQSRIVRHYFRGESGKPHLLNDEGDEEEDIHSQKNLPQSRVQSSSFNCKVGLNLDVDDRSISQILVAGIAKVDPSCRAVLEILHHIGGDP